MLDIFTAEDNVYRHVEKVHEKTPVDAVLVDEAQFLTEEQVWQLANLADQLGIPVMCFGLRTDFQGKLFPGSAALLAIADNLKEIKTICWCGRKATMVARLDGNGRIVEEGEQVVIGGNETYVSLCRKHWRPPRTGLRPREGPSLQNTGPQTRARAPGIDETKKLPASKPAESS